jgi:hypothetical protein
MSGVTAVRHFAAFGVLWRVSSAPSINAHAHPYGRSKVRRASGSKYATSVEIFSAVSCESNSDSIAGELATPGNRRSNVANSQ